MTLLGHAHPAVTRAVSEQAGRLTFYSNTVPIEIRTRAAERLCAFAPDGIEHVFFCNSRSAAPVRISIGANFCDVGIACRGRMTIAMAALDNLVKGMAGTAIQNMNLMCGLPETTGLWTPSFRPI